MTTLILTGQWLRTATHSFSRMLAAHMDALAEARIHRTAIERELHRGCFSHASKNDDDIPHFISGAGDAERARA